MSPRKRSASPAAAAAKAPAGGGDNANDDNAPSPAAAAKKRRASASPAAAAASPAKKAPTPRKPSSASPAPASAAKKKATTTRAKPSHDENEPYEQKAPAAAAAAAEKKKAPARAAAAAKTAAPPKDADAGADASDAPSYLGPAPVPFSKAKDVVPYDPATMRPETYQGPGWRVVSWNVAGLRALLAKHPGALAAIARRERADALCLQETKLQDADAERLFGPAVGSAKDLGETLGLPGWSAAAWACSGGNGTKKGYAGVAVLARRSSARVAWAQAGFGGTGEHDDEGRAVVARLEDAEAAEEEEEEGGGGGGGATGCRRPPLTLVGVYVPNSGEGLKRLDYRTNEWDPALVEFVGGLLKGRQGEEKGGGEVAAGGGDDNAARPLVVVAGDLNVAHREVDIHSPSTNKRSAGFTVEERASFSAGLIGGSGLAAGEGGGGGGGGAKDGGGLALVDSFRAMNPKAVGYTYYSYRSRARVSGKGWRLDYCLVPEWLLAKNKEEGDGTTERGGDGQGKQPRQPRLHDAYILADVSASDHVPLGVVIKT